MTTPSDLGTGHPAPLGTHAEAARQRLVQLREQLLTETRSATTPAVARALEMADVYLFLALGYLGHTDELLPDHRE